MPQKLIFKGEPKAIITDFLLDVYLEISRLDQFYINPHLNIRALFDPAKGGDLLWGTLPNERRANKRIFSKMLGTYLDNVSDVNLSQADIIAGLDEAKTNAQVADFWFSKITFDT